MLILKEQAKSLAKINAKALIGSQTIIEDLPFSQQNYEDE